MGLSNTAGTISGVVGVALTGLLLEHYGGSASRGGWTVALGLSGLLCVAGNVYFLRAARGERLFD